MARPTIIVVGGSAGALEPLVTLLKQLPRGFPASILVAVHSSPTSPGMLPAILERAGNLSAIFPHHGQRLEPGRVYVAPPDHHLRVDNGAVSVLHGPRENGFRPAIDPLFRSAAESHDGRTIGVLLSGALDDGTFGLMAIKRAGGTAIVQHPEDALVPSMPLSAIRHVEVDHIVPAKMLAPLLIDLLQNGRPAHHPEERRNKTHGAAMEDDRDINQTPQKPDAIPGSPSFFVCPECGGALWERDEGGLQRFRCHTGHGFTPETLLAHQNSEVEHALWCAVRVLQERAAMHRQIATRMRDHGSVTTADRYDERSHEEDAKAAVIRKLLANEPPPLAEPP